MSSSSRWPAIAAIAISLFVSSPLPGQESRAAESAPVLTAAEVDALLKQLEGDDTVQTEAAFVKLCDAGLLIPNLDRVLQGTDRSVLAWTMYRLIELGPSAKSWTDPVLEKLETLAYDDALPELFMRALAAMGTPSDRIAEAFKKTFQTKSGLQFGSPGFSFGSLFRYDRAGGWSVPVVAAALESPNAYMRHRAAKELGKYGPKALTALPALLAALSADYPPKGKSKDPAADLIAVSYGEKASDVFTKPTAGGWSAAESSFLEYRNPYLWAISRIGPGARIATKPLLEIASGGHVALRPDALRALAAISPANPDVLKLAIGWVGHPNPFLRLAAEDAIQLLGPRAAAARKDLVKILADARPYELRAIFRTLEAIGPEKEPVIADLIAAVKKPKPDAASIVAAHRLGLVEQPDGGILAALREALKAKPPALVCACALSLGRLVPSPGAAAKDLLDVLRAIELEEDMGLWEATKASFVTEALGRLGPASSDARDRMMRMMRDVKEQSWAVMTLSGLTEREIARACLMIRTPSHALMRPVAVDAAVNSEPAWYADWALDPPDAGVVLWAHLASPTHLLLEFGSFPDAWADWSTTFGHDRMTDFVLLSLRREEEGLDVRLLDFDLAVQWALQRAPESRPTDLYKLECRMMPVDLDSAERLDLDFRTRDTSARDHEAWRWRGGFSIPNPFRKAEK